MATFIAFFLLVSMKASWGWYAFFALVLLTKGDVKIPTGKSDVTIKVE